MEISKDLRCVFSAEIDERDGAYVIEIPGREMELETLREGEVYRVAVLARESDDRVDGTDQSADGVESATGESPQPSATSSTSTARSEGNRHADESSRDDSIGGDAPEPPVDRGDEVTVDIEGIGDQGDGIARVDRGYVIIVPDTEKGERVRIRVTSVKQNVAFAEVVDRVERHQYE